MQTVIKNCNNIAEGKYYNENHRLSEEIQPRMGLFVRADLHAMVSLSGKSSIKRVVPDPFSAG